MTIITETHTHPHASRFPTGKGIAGFVADTAQTLNIKRAYEDERFNPAIDEQTGYKTGSILCMPIHIRGTVIGVIQMINKKSGGGVFTRVGGQNF